MYAAFNYGDVLVTMGTGKLTQREEEGMGLAGEHDYAVIDMKQCEGQQFFLIKNPWSEGTIWKGHTFLKNSVTDIRDTLGSLALADKVSPKGDGNFPLAPGTFWMGLNDVFQSFESIYLNWNTSLFSFKEDIHFDWDLSTYSSPDGSLEANPQYMVCSKAGGTVWLLLSRHFTTSSHDLSEELKASSPQKSEPGFISLCSFNNGGERVIFSDGANIHSPYVDSPNTLLKMELPAAEPVTIAVSEQALPRSRNRFTLSAFSLASLGLCEAREKFCYSAKQDGAWTASTAGGNASGLSYHTNPQYSLCLDKTSDLCLLLESLTEDLPIHVKLIWARGKPIHSITSRDVVGDSGEYRKGFTLATILGVPAGVYTVVCSTFESGQLGSFALRVKSVSPCSLGKISVTSAGRFVTKARTAVFTPGNTRLLARILSQRLNRVSVTAWSCRDSSGSDQGICSPLKLSIDYGQGPSKQTLGTSGEDEYLDGRAGLHLPEVDIQPNLPQAEGLWLVIERVAFSGLQSDEQVTVELVSDGPIEVHGWGVGEDGKTHLH